MKPNSILIRSALLVLGAFFFIKGVVLAEGFLVPLTFAVVLTLITIPLARKLEKKGFSHLWASVTSVIVCILAYLAFFFVIAAQIGSVSERWPEMKKQLTPKLSEAVQKIEDKTGMNVMQQIPPWLNGSGSMSNGDDREQSEPDQETNSQSENSEKKQDSQSAAASGRDSGVPDGVKKQLGQLAVNIFGFLGNSLLTFIDLFFLLHYRQKVKLSILRFFDADKQKQVKDVLEESVKLGLNFLGGRFLLILSLAIIYTTGLLIAGVEDAILIGLLAALMSLIPYVGVVGGYILAIAMTFLGGAENWALIVVTVTYGLAQFIEGNILEPFIVGDKVNINPLVTVIVVVLGSAIWGVAGMILSIPIVGICKIVFDSVKKLEPLGYALGEEDVSDPNEEGFMSKWGEKLRGMFKKK